MTGSAGTTCRTRLLTKQPFATERTNWRGSWKPNWLDSTREVAESLVEELTGLEAEYGVQLPTLHDHVNERIIGALAVNRMTARVGRCSPGLDGSQQAEAAENFQVLRQEIADFMETRLGSGIEPPDWMQQLAREFERTHSEQMGLNTESLVNVDFQRVTQKEIDQQLSRLLDDDR